MLTLTRPREEAIHGGPPADGPPHAPGQLNALRAQGQRLLHAGDDAIERALSTDSLRFLQEVEQVGGQ
jgi:hypothetical protein